jgi:hypothetical protein
MQSVRSGPPRSSLMAEGTLSNDLIAIGSRIAVAVLLGWSAHPITTNAEDRSQFDQEQVD